MKHGKTQRQKSALERLRNSTFAESKAYRTFMANVEGTPHQDELDARQELWEDAKEERLQILSEKLALKGAL